MIELVTCDAMRAWSRTQRAAGRRIGFVPTMGYLHEGHLRLIDAARRRADVVVVSVFVNPAQFGPHEDFARYPRDPEHDRAHAAARGTDCLFLPATEEIYPRPPVISLSPGALADHLCGPFRPGHFAGVLLVVAKLFNVVEPDLAVFGRKDAQQAIMLRRLADDLSFPVELHVAPTVREADGLALSSRNVYLSASERTAALALPRALAAAHAAFAAGERRAEALLETGRSVLAAADGLELEYLTLVDPVTIQPVTEAAADAILAVAARVGRTRLIDNVVIGRGVDGDDRLDG